MDPLNPAWKVKTALFSDSLWTAVQKAFDEWTIQLFLPTLAKDLKGEWAVTSSHISAGNMMQVSSTLSSTAGGKINLYLSLIDGLKVSVLAAYYSPADPRDVAGRHRGEFDSFSGVHTARDLARELNATFKL